MVALRSLRRNKDTTRNADASDSHRVIFGRFHACIYFYAERKGRPAEDNYVTNSLQSFPFLFILANEGESKEISAEKDGRYYYLFNEAYYYVFCYWLSRACKR